MSTSGDGFRNVPAVANPPIRNHRDAMFVGDLSRIVDRCDLRHTNSRYHSRRANRTRSDAHLDRIRAGIKQAASDLATEVSA